uniref:Uncharacterized protein n=1 Tax=Anguilla anguilla TaxID=7936 RepID=A0A0E9XLN9_ANGAN
MWLIMLTAAVHYLQLNWPTTCHCYTRPYAST